MSQSAIMRAIMRAGLPGYCPIDEMVRAERRRFPSAKIIRPGHDLLPVDDWLEAVVTLNGKVARVILVDARVQGAGAFTRLAAALGANGFTPVVVDPTGRFMATLMRRGWKLSLHGRSFKTRETRMTP